MFKMCVPIIALFLVSCGSEGGEEGLKEQLRKHPVGGSPAVMLKKSGIAESWLATIHGYLDNMSVCEDMIKPYNENPSLSDVEGTYYCQPVT